MKAKSPAQRLALSLVRTYQIVLSPLLGGSCRFYPSCSHYTMEAIERWGPRRGAWLGRTRVLLSRAFGGRGYDPVPENLPEHEDFGGAARRQEKIRTAGVTH